MTEGHDPVEPAGVRRFAPRSFRSKIVLSTVAIMAAAMVLMGLGILSLFRHKASVGGINILALYLQENFGVRAGYFQLGVDAVILVAAFFVLPFDRVIYSILGALVLNMIIATNHKPGRYVGFS